ncbi:MAG: peptidase [Acidimicrobiaceae bacterium]|nr:peptidase [Acidimicrobiaceae bacterium]
MSAGVLVAGIGNIFLSDDGFGCEVAHRLARRELPAGVIVTDYGIRGMHLAYDLLDGYDGLVLVDALPAQGAPGRLVVLEVTEEDLGSGDFDAHGMEPTAVLGSLGTLGGRLPRTFVVGCEAAELGEGIGLSSAVEGALDGAVEAVLELLDGQLADPSGSMAKENYS